MQINDMQELIAAVLEILPDAIFEENREGEIIVLSGYKYVEGTLDEELERI